MKDNDFYGNLRIKQISYQNITKLLTHSRKKRENFIPIPKYIQHHHFSLKIYILYNLRWFISLSPKSLAFNWLNWEQSLFEIIILQKELQIEDFLPIPKYIKQQHLPLKMSILYNLWWFNSLSPGSLVFHISKDPIFIIFQKQNI